VRTKEKLFYSIGILTFAIIVIFGLTYAFIFANLTGTDTPEVITIRSARSGSPLTAIPGPTFFAPNNIAPGWSESYTFSVQNNTNGTVTYNLAFTDVVNTLVNQETLVFSLTSTNGGGTLNQTQIPNTNGRVLSNITIPANTTQEYTITISYLNADFNQIEDLGRTFSITILVD